MYASRWDVKILRKRSLKSHEVASTRAGLDGLVGDCLSFQFRWEKMSVSDSCTLSRSVGRGRRAESFISWLYLCTAFNTTTNQRRGDLPRSTGSFNPVSAIKLTVAWNLYAPLSGSITIPSSPLRCASIPSNTLSRLNQKLSCDTVLEKRSLVSLDIAWMALIHALACEWRE